MYEISVFIERKWDAVFVVRAHEFRGQEARSARLDAAQPYFLLAVHAAVNHVCSEIFCLIEEGA